MRQSKLILLALKEMRKRLYPKNGSIIFTFFIGAFFVLSACGGGDDDSNNNYINTENENQAGGESYFLGPSDNLWQQVVGTWRLSSEDSYDSSGNLVSSYHPGTIIILSNIPNTAADNHYNASADGKESFTIAGHTYYYYWGIKRPNYISIQIQSIIIGDIIDIKNNGFTVSSEKSDGGYQLYIFEKVSSNGGNTSFGHSPQFTNFTYTATRTYATVQFYTDERATSASIRYGSYSPSTSVSAVISDKKISATIYGLTKGTKYYVSCTARNDYGSTTSDSYPIITNY